MASCVDNDERWPPGTSQELRELVLHLHRLNRPPNDEEVAKLLKLARPLPPAKLGTDPLERWPKPEPPPPEPNGAEIPLRHDPT